MGVFKYYPIVKSIASHLRPLCTARSGTSTNVVLIQPSARFVFLACSQVLLGNVMFVIGLSAFTYTPSHNIGSFWAGFVLIVTGCTRLSEIYMKTQRNRQRLKGHWDSAVFHITFALQVLSISTCSVATVTDILAAYLLQNTDFSQCAYTPFPSTIHCNSTICPTLIIPAQTCYCCYLYDYRTSGGCETTLLTAKQTYFISVNSCSVVPATLLPMLYTLGSLGVLGGMVSVAVFCHRQLFVRKEAINKDHNALESGIPGNSAGRQRVLATQLTCTTSDGSSKQTTSKQGASEVSETTATIGTSREVRNGNDLEVSQIVEGKGAVLPGGGITAEEEGKGAVLPLAPKTAPAGGGITAEEDTATVTEVAQKNDVIF